MSTADNNKRTELGALGEFGIIDRIAENFKTHKQASTALGIGDDAALIDCGDFYQVISTDMLVEGIHFDLSYMPLQHLGFKSVSVNISDIAAMNAIPKQITVNVALSNRFSVEAVDAIYDGIQKACDTFGVDLVGGDTTSSPGGLMISITAIGTAEKDTVVKRSGASSGDIICATGDLGAAYIGLQVLMREKAEFKANPNMQPKLEQYDYVVGRQLRPMARMDVIHELGKLGVVPTAMMDISDGLASELMHISKQSNVGVNVFEDKLPIHQITYENAVEFQLDPVIAAMNGGEDYELLFCIKQDDYEKIKNLPDVHTIGYIQDLEKGRNLVSKQGNVYPLKAQGFTHM
ncbi:thiamine-phosphate kinase [Persicobacter diffluens]|uniref:Thiamine-monophosphate kinase n=1 Tax=Persicobacter diffluens TaxID=981 RepID=A0AAN5AIT5_9BACT|nr:thiamine-monophosphate kinase [Persicobacter diffluens]